MRCAIIGSQGYIGQNLNFYLKERFGVTAQCYDIHNLEIPYYRQLDLTDMESVRTIDLNIDYIFMLAGLTGTNNGFDNYSSFINVNEIGLLNLLEYLRRSNSHPKIVYPSSRLVYKGKDNALKEEDDKETKTIYAVNKLACEGYLKVYSNSFDIPYTIFRICVPYGNLLATNYSYGTILFFINQAKAGKDITLYGGGEIKRTFTHIEDICFQMIEGASRQESNNKIYNIGGETLSLCEAAEIVAAKFGTKVVSVPWPERDLRIESDHTYFDDTKIRALLGNMTYKRLEDFSKDLIK